ncbi:unnamed protein product [Discula destructiva]
MATRDGPAAPAAATKPQQKRIHSLVVDTGPLIKNEPSTSTLIALADHLYTIPSVISEIKDEATRSRVQTTLLPFLTLRSPQTASIKFICDFARRTGDLEVLSKPDIHLLALTYELELERNGGDWRIRRDPAQKGLNGKPPSASPAGAKDENMPVTAEDSGPQEAESITTQETPETVAPQQETALPETSSDMPHSEAIPIEISTIESKLENLNLDATVTEQPRQEHDATMEPADDESDNDDDEGWITPSNLKQQQAKDASAAGPKESSIQGTLQAALLTSDFAMQNVALRINLNLISPSGLARIRQLKTWVLRCHGCFAISKKMDRQFCPKCGQATLTRVSCSTDTSGNTQLHLKKNFVYNKRGNVYSIPKPTHGSANGKLGNVQGGGKGHWGAGLILTEDQKEYTRKAEEDRRARKRDVMDEDFLPDLLSGRRAGGHGKIKVGAGRNVNAKKR